MQRRQRALALLIERRFDDYELEATGVGLPTRSQDVRELTDPDDLLAAALLDIPTDPNGAMGRISAVLATTTDAELRVTAAIFQGILLSSAGRPDLAASALLDQEKPDLDPTTAGLLLVHAGLRNVEAGNVEEGLAQTTRVEGILKGHRDVDAGTIRVVAAMNAWQFGWLAGRPQPSMRFPLHESPLLAWLDGAADEALTAYLDEQFTGYFQDPNTRTVRFGTEDRVDANLSRALLRAEAIAYRQSILRLRQSLGRYRLLTQAEPIGPTASTGFELMRRAGDHQGLRQALRVYRAAGPLEVLRAVGEAVTTASWLQAEMHADLAIIAETALTYRAKVAQQAFDRLMLAMPDVLERQFAGGWLADSGFRALGALIPLVDVPRLNAVSAWLRRVAEGQPNPLIHQSMGPALHALDWRHLTRRERDAWQGYVEANLGAKDDRLFPARSVAFELARTRSRRAARSIFAAYRQGQSLWVAPLMVDMPGLSKDDMETLARDVIRSAQALRRQAAEGSFSLGGPGTGALLGRAARRFRRRDLFEEFDRFVNDPAVPLDERIAAVLPILERPEVAPKWLRGRLASGVPQPNVDFFFFGDPAPLEMVNLRLRTAFGSVPTYEAIAVLLRFANDARVELRRDAAWTATKLWSAAPIPIGTLLLSLSYDAVPQVRGMAGRGLARLRFEDDELDGTRVRRIIELLQEAGEAVPREVWLGVAQAASDGQQPASEILALSTEVARNHIAMTVRRAAESAAALNG